MRQKTFKQSFNGDNPFSVGDLVVLVEKYNENNGDTSWEARIAPEGVGGNTDPAIKKFHGWRGTTSNVGIYAHGIREIIKTKSIDDGLGVIVKITVGPDLHPDWE